MLQLVDVLAEPMGLSMTLRQGLLVVLAVGFLLTLVLAWYHGEKGHQRVSGPELLIIAGLAAIAGLGLMLLGGGEGESEVDEPEAAAPAAAGGRPAIAVLPFDDLSADPENAYITAGMHDQIISTLAGISGIRVIPRTSVMQYTADVPAVGQIANELGADYVLEGTVRVEGDSIGLTVRLIDVLRDEPLWADTWNRALSAQQLRAVQGEIARQIAFEVGTSLTPGERNRIGRVLTESTRAYLLFLQGNETFLVERMVSLPLPRGRSPTDLYEQAVAADSSFALARAALALSLSYSLSRDSTTQARVRTEAERALRLVSDLPEAHVALARYHAKRGDTDEAFLQLALVEQGFGDFPGVLLELGDLQRRTGSFDAAITTFERAAALDPLNPLVHVALAQSLTHAHRFDGALLAYARAQELDYPVLPDIRRPLEGSGPYIRARVLMEVAYVHLLMGDRPSVDRILAQILEFAPGEAIRGLEYLPRGVLGRLLSDADRQREFGKIYRPGAQVASCEHGFAIIGACLFRAIHEEAVGSRDRALQMWDSLRVTARRLPLGRPHPGEVLAHWGARDTATALAVADALTQPLPNGVNDFAEDQFLLLPAARTFQARILAAAGQSEKAIDLLEELLPPPSWLSPHVLRADPIWEPLWDNPDFEALLARYEGN